MSTSALCYGAALTAAPPSACGGGVRHLPAGAGGFRGVGFTLPTMAPPPKPKVKLLVTAAARPKLTAAAAARPKLLVRTVTGYSGLGRLLFDPASPTMDLPRFSVKAACSKADGQDSGSEEESFSKSGQEGSKHDKVLLVMQLEQVHTALGEPIHPLEMTHLNEGEAAVLTRLREIAEKGYSIVRDASDRTRPEPGSPLFEALFGIGLEFLGIKRYVISPVGMSMILVARLDTVRRIVSSACDIPLPRALTYKPDDESLMFDSLHEEIVQLVESFCRTVEDDVKSMLSTKY